MRRLLLTLMLAIGLVAPVAAQTTTVTLHAQWDQVPNDFTVIPNEIIDHYNFVLDNQAPILVLNTLDPTCTCVQTAFAVTGGTHTISVTTVDAMGQVSVPATLTFTLNGGPAGVKNLRVGK